MKTKKMNIAKSLVFYILVFLPAAGFSQDIEYVKDVRIVHNGKPVWGNEPRIGLEFVQKIGVLDGDDENYLFYQPRDVVIDSDKNIYILDAGNFRIQKFDPEGKYLSTIGRKGEGPSEFTNPNNLEIDRNGNLYVFTSRNGMVQKISPGGKELQRFTIGHYVYAGRLLSDGNIVVKSGWDVSQGVTFINQNRSINKLVNIFDSDGKHLYQFGDPVVRIIDERQIIDSSCFITVDKNNSIYVTYGFRNLIEKYSNDGRLIMQIDRPIDGHILEKDETNSSSRYVAPPGISKSIAVDGKERIWVLTHKRQYSDIDKDESRTSSDLYEMHLFDKEGVFSGVLNFDKFGILMRIYGDRFFFIDETHGMCVYEYKIVEK